MKPSTKRELNFALANVVEQVLRNPLKLNSADEIARQCGYSRFHLTRVFLELTGEPLMGFVRRIRLERSAVRLLNGDRVGEAASASGFDSVEAFSRAFKRAYSVSPRGFVRQGSTWKLASPENLHWNEYWDPDLDDQGLRARYSTKLDRCPPLRLALVEHIGNYSRLSEGWEKVSYSEGRKWVTLYLDNMWTSPRRELMRSGLGFVCPSGPAPDGFHIVEVPAGLTLKTTRFVERNERNEAWAYISGTWPNHVWGWDEYESWPLPFENVRTCICIRLSD